MSDEPDLVAVPWPSDPRGTRLLPRVSAILKGSFEMPRDEAAALRGTYVHQATAMLDGGGDGSGLDWSDLDPALEGYVRSWERGRDALALKVEMTECLVWSPAHRFVGHADRIGVTGDRWAIVDLKTGGQESWHRLQTAAYAQAASESLAGKGIIMRPAACWRIALYLRADGDMPASACWRGPDLFREDLAGFLACAQVWAWKRNHR